MAASILNRRPIDKGEAGTMNPEEETDRPTPAQAQAADWFVRLQSDKAIDDDWTGFRAWLEASPEHERAFAAVEALWLELDDAADVLGRASAPVPLPVRRRRAALSPWVLMAGAAAAAALALVVLLPVAPGPPAQVYAVAKGQNRWVKLADGTTVQLNTGSTLKVRLGRAAREVELVGDEAEAAFDVAKDPARPFVIAAGDGRIRVVGTAFNVRRGAGRLAVTVQRGIVEVASSQGAPPVRLTPGRQLMHRDGGPDVISTVDPSIALAWRRGELIYRDQSLAEVAEDLNRYFDRPVTVEAGAAQLTFTGALKFDDEEAVVRRLEVFLPISARASGQGVVLARRSP